MSKATIDQWAITQKKQILMTLRARYGDMWRSCFPREVRKALVEREILMLILGQAMTKYDPAKELARRVLNEFSKDENTEG